MTEGRPVPEERNAPVSRTLRIQIDIAIRQAIASGADEADACQQVLAIVGSRINKLNARRSFKMIIQ